MITSDDLRGLTLDERLRLVALEAEEGGLPGWVRETAHQAADLLEALKWDLSEIREPPQESPR